MPNANCRMNTNEPKFAYIVTEGEYSDYHIVRVFLDKKTADDYVAIYGGDVVEWEIDVGVPEPYRWCAKIDASGQVWDVREMSPTPKQSDYTEPVNAHPNDKHNPPFRWWMILGGSKAREGLEVFGRTKEEAIKIASEKWAAAKALIESVNLPTS